MTIEQAERLANRIEAEADPWYRFGASAQKHAYDKDGWVVQAQSAQTGEWMPVIRDNKHWNRIRHKYQAKKAESSEA